MNSVIALGLMCGTSVDAIDVAWLRSDGKAVLEFGSTLSLPVPEDAKALIKAAMIDARGVLHRNERTPLMMQAEDVVDALHIQAILEFAKKFPNEYQKVELIGYHGQTVFHAPEKGITIQLGRGEKLAQQFKIPVVYDFRAADVAAGGQGAPLVPVFHQALAMHYNLPKPCVFVNIGGVANVTYVNFDARKGDPQSRALDNELLAFDCGPGNALIDDAMMRLFQQPYDHGGQVALSGKVDEQALAHLLSHEFFKQMPPKSLDRNGLAFPSPIMGEGARRADEGENINRFNNSPSSVSASPMASQSHLLPLWEKGSITTLTEFTVQAIIKSAEYYPESPKLWVIAGGGVHNQYIMQRLHTGLNAPVCAASDYAISEDFLEAQAFAYLAIRSHLNLPITFPFTTGVSNPLTGGVVVRV